MIKREITVSFLFKPETIWRSFLQRAVVIFYTETIVNLHLTAAWTVRKMIPYIWYLASGKPALTSALFL